MTTTRMRTGGVRGRAAIALLAGTLIAAGCTTVGEGAGSGLSGESPVTFGWTSKDGGLTGTMTATFADGRVFVGPFLEITSTARLESLEPLWTGWQPGWSDWRYWGPYPDAAFATRYSGRVLANLEGAGAHRLRCRFQLNAPEAGMRGGGQGDCQAGDGQTIDAVFKRR